MRDPRKGSSRREASGSTPAKSGGGNATSKGRSGCPAQLETFTGASAGPREFRLRGPAMRLQFVHVRPSFIVQRARPHPSPDAMWTRASSRTCWRDDALRVTGGPPTARWPDSVTQTVDRAIQTPSVIARAHAILRRWAYLVPSFLSPMEAQVIEDKRKARLCDECGHS